MLDWRGPDITSGLGINRHLRSRKFMKGHRRSFPIIRLTFQVRKVMGGIVQSAMLVCAVSYVGGLWDYSDRPSPIWDLGIGLGLVNF